MPSPTGAWNKLRQLLTWYPRALIKRWTGDCKWSKHDINTRVPAKKNLSLTLEHRLKKYVNNHSNENLICTCSKSSVDSMVSSPNGLANDFNKSWNMIERIYTGSLIGQIDNKDS